MESGSIQEVEKRLQSWCVRQVRGFARVEWDSAYARQDVVDRLKGSLSGVGIPVVEIGLPSGGPAYETIARLIEKLQSVSGSVVSITGIEWAFPEGGNPLDPLVALSFQREILAAIPVRQIWWVPSTLTERLVLGVPDLDSWFRLRLHLTEMPPRPVEAFRGAELSARDAASVGEARALARRFWERLDRARSQNTPEERIWTELAQPAVEALQSAGLEHEADEILARTSNARGELELKLKELVSARGAEDSEVLSLMMRLARLLRYQGDLAGARQLEERVLELRTRALGEEHADTLMPMNNLAITLLKQGDLAGARRLQERVLEVRRRVLGEEHPVTLRSMNNLAVTLSKQGDLAGARRLQERVREVMGRVLGEEHPATLTSIHNMAFLLSRAGDHESALPLLRKCLLGRLKVLGENHPDTIDTAQLLKRQEALSEARPR